MPTATDSRETFRHAVEHFTAWAAPRLDAYLRPLASGPETGAIGDPDVEQHAATLLREAQEIVAPLLREYIQSATGPACTRVAPLLDALCPTGALDRAERSILAISDSGIWQICDCDDALTQLVVEACARIAPVLAEPEAVRVGDAEPSTVAARVGLWLPLREEYVRRFGPYPLAVDAVAAARMLLIAHELFPAPSDRAAALAHAPARRTASAQRTLALAGAGTVWERLVVTAVRDHGRALVLPVGAEQGRLVVEILRTWGWTPTDIALFARGDAGFDYEGCVAAVSALFSGPARQSSAATPVPARRAGRRAM